MVKLLFYYLTMQGSYINVSNLSGVAINVETTARAQAKGALTSQSRDAIPEATYSTFQDSGHYSIKVRPALPAVMR